MRKRVRLCQRAPPAMRRHGRRTPRAARSARDASVALRQTHHAGQGALRCAARARPGGRTGSQRALQDAALSASGAASRASAAWLARRTRTRLGGADALRSCTGAIALSSALHAASMLATQCSAQAHVAARGRSARAQLSPALSAAAPQRPPRSLAAARGARCSRKRVGAVHVVTHSGAGLADTRVLCGCTHAA